MKLLKELNKSGLIHPPNFLLDNIAYLCMMGSVAYGVADVGSDVDIYGFCIPKKDLIFPHLSGEIAGFGKQHERFGQWQQHHIIDKSSKKEYDFSIYNIVKFFDLCMANNPNMVDALFVPRRCVIHSTQVGELVRSNRKMFLHKGSFHKFKGYAYSQMHKMRIKTPKEGSKRYESIKLHGYDVKFAYHVVRLISECEQILVEHDLDLQKNREQLKSIRRGEWSLGKVEKFFESKEAQLEEIYNTSTLQYKPDEEKIKELLLQCLEIHYGSLSDCIRVVPDIEKDMEHILNIANKYA